MLNGNGSEQIFLPPSVPGEAYTALSLDRSVLKQQEDGTFYRRMIDGTEEEYDSNGLLQIVRDRNGNETTFHFSDEGKIEKIVDPVGLTTTFRYSGGLVSQIEDPAGRITTLNHVSKNLTSVTDPDLSLIHI